MLKLIHRLIQKKVLFRGGYLLLSSLLLIAAFGCNNCRLPPITIDGKEYCVTDEWICSEAWYSCYLRGVSCAQCRAMECLLNARGEFSLAMERGKDNDGRWACTYGMHRLPEYFPNRELGVVSYHLYELNKNYSDLEDAGYYLTKSLGQCESAKAKHYLNKVRKEKLLLSGVDLASPQLELAPLDCKVATPTITLSGLAKDDTFVANVLIQVNDEKPVSLMELSQPLSYTFRQNITLRQGINDVSVKAVDLLGKGKEEKIKILVDQEGPMVYFAQPDENGSLYRDSIQGILYDPSNILEFSLNRKKVELTSIEIEKETNSEKNMSTEALAYFFRYNLSAKEQKEGILQYRIEDSLHNVTTGTIDILTEEQQAREQKVPPLGFEPIQIAMAPLTATTDNLSQISPFFLMSERQTRRQTRDPIRIQITHAPTETFEEEVCLHINILTYCQIKGVSINDQPVLSIYGLRWDKLFASAISYLFAKGEGRFLFQRVIKLKGEGVNVIKVKVIDKEEGVWEKSIQIKKKIKQIHHLQERWRIAIPCISYNQNKKEDNEMKKSMTHKLMEAFYNQKRFWVVDLEGLEKVIEEKNLSYYIDIPHLGVRDHHKIMVDVFLLTHITESYDSFNFLGSLIDFETGEILANKEVYEEIKPLGPSKVAWDEGQREHVYQNCYVLAAKFKEHFPICEGNIISLTKEGIIKTTICKNDGLKEKMKLIVYNSQNNDQNQEDNTSILAEAEVCEVQETYSLATLLKKLDSSNNGENEKKWKVITK